MTNVYKGVAEEVGSMSVPTIDLNALMQFVFMIVILTVVLNLIRGFTEKIV